jgi:hypothetical protein
MLNLKAGYWHGVKLHGYVDTVFAASIHRFAAGKGRVFEQARSYQRELSVSRQNMYPVRIDVDAFGIPLYKGNCNFSSGCKE